jgi:predicted dehydrogenase
MNPLRAGLLGCGGIGTRHAAAIAALPEALQLVACAGREESKVAAFAGTVGATGYTDIRRMLDRERLDLLIVALPPSAHAGQVELAAAAGVHLLVEKPIALDMERAQSMIAAAERARIVAACGFMYRFGAAVEWWEAAKAAGETGRAGLFAGQFHCNALHASWWRERARSGGQIIEQLIHILDLARCQLGEPQHVYARAANVFHRGVTGYDSEDVSAIVFGYDDGRVGVLNATNGAVPGRWEKLWQIIAERMTARFTGWNSAEFTNTGATPPQSERIESDRDVFVAQLADVAAAIRERRAPRVPLAEGARTLRLALAARRSADERREIAL